MDVKPYFVARDIAGRSRAVGEGKLYRRAGIFGVDVGRQALVAVHPDVCWNVARKYVVELGAVHRD